MSKINIYTDGAAKGNPGKGGYGIVLEYLGQIKEISQGFRLTTNNRMELLAVIVGLEAINKKGHEVIIYSDSKYVVDAVNKNWVFSWEKNNYKKKKNPDLWRRFLKIYKVHKVSLKWIKGHSGHVQNERCDRLAVAAAESSNLKIDAAYEANNPTSKNLFD